VPTIKEACETVVSESPLNCTKNCTGNAKRRRREHPCPFAPVKMRTIIENHWQQSSRRKQEAKQNHARDRHLGQRDLAKEKSCSPKASGRCESKYGDSITVPLEHLSADGKLAGQMAVPNEGIQKRQ